MIWETTTGHGANRGHYCSKIGAFGSAIILLYSADLRKQAADFDPMTQRKFSVPGAAPILFLLLTACGGDDRQSPVEAGLDSQTLYFNVGSEVQNLDPHTVTGVPESRVLRSLLEGLTGKDATDLSPIPAAAESWTISPDGRRYRFRLRSDGRWSNGDPVTAADFAYAWRRLLSPNLAAEYAYMLYPISGAEDYHQGRLKDFSEVGVRVIDPLTLEVRLRNPTPYFLQLLDHYVSFPVHRPTIEKHGPIDRRNTAWTRPQHFVGNGPYHLISWEINRKIIVRKRQDYWDAGSHRLREIHFLPVDNATVEERMFRTGQLHLSASVPTEKIPIYRRDHPELLRESPLLATYYFELNVARPPLNDRRVRRALAMSVDRGLMIKLLKGGQLPALAMTPPDTAGYHPPEDGAFAPERARQLLAEAGYPNGDGFPSLQLLYNTSEGHRKIAEAVQQMWQRHLNIAVQLDNQEWKVYLNSRNQGNFDIARAGWVGDYPDPTTFLDLLMSNSGNNRTGWKNRSYDRLIERAAGTNARDRRYTILRRAEALMLREMPVIPIYTYVSHRLVHPSVKGWHSNLMDYHPYRDIHLEASP